MVRYPDLNKRVFKTISLKVPPGCKMNVDYSAVSLEDIIIDALPLKATIIPPLLSPSPLFPSR